jgi:hypothetical protein
MVFRRFIRRYGVFMLGLGMMAGSARATSTYTTPSSFNSAVSGLTGVVGSAFTSAGLQPGALEYIDTVTGVDFFGFADSGGTEGAADSLSVSGGVLQASSFALIEIVLPANTLAVEFSIGATTSGLFCFDPTPTFDTGGSCDATLFVSSPASPQFAGAVNATAFSTVWVGPLSGSPTVTIDSFEVFSNQSTQSGVPEGPTDLLIGSGLTALYWLHRRRRQPLPV